jgi:hypothetical protein
MPSAAVVDDDDDDTDSDPEVELERIVDVEN